MFVVLRTTNNITKMKRSFLMMLVSILLMACGQTSNAETTKESSKQVKNPVEVIYFHGKQRCATCRAIEQCTKDVLDEQFAKQVKVGKVVLRVIDISQKENKAIAEKYEVTSFIILSGYLFNIFL